MHAARTTLGALVDEQAAKRPDACSLLAPGRLPLSYEGLREQVRAVSDALGAVGVTPTTRVALVLPNGPEMATAFVGVAACATCAPLNPAYQASEFRFYLEDLRAGVVVMRKDENGPLRRIAAEMGLAVVEIDADISLPAGRFRLSTHAAVHGKARSDPLADDVALILHTSGTTAKPKIVPLSHANLLASASNIARHLKLQPTDRCLNVMPLFHIHGLVAALLASIASGASVVCTPGFETLAFFDWIAEFEPTWYTAVPTIHQSVLAQGALYKQRAPQHRFRFVRSSSAALPPKTFEALQALTDAPVVEAYGMTEASHQMASNPLPPGRRKPGSVGVAAGVDIALMDQSGRLLVAGATGEIVIRGPGVTSGYEGNVEANAGSFTDGWFRTGDQGHVDDEGYLYISGRLKEIVNRGGEKISPREIDEALLEHPAVAQAVAFALPHATLGEDLVAAVVLRDAATCDEPGLRSFLFARLADYKVPSAILFVDTIPKGATGKIQRTSLHEKLGHLLAQPFVAARNDVERSLAAIFSEVLLRVPVGVHDNFFALGGDSLKAARVMSRITAQHGVDLALALLFRHPTIVALAVEVGAAKLAADDCAKRIEAEIDEMSDEEVARLLAEEQARLVGARG